MVRSRDSDHVTVTTDAPLPWEESGERPVARRLHLVTSWSLDEPHRVGETCAVRSPSVIGRGGQQDGDPGPRVEFRRQRPGVNERTPWLMGSRVSRTQLLVEPWTDGTLRVRNLGRCPMFHNGIETFEATVADGDTLTLKNSLVFYAESRPEELVPMTFYPDDGEFGFGRADPDGMVGESSVMWQVRENIAFAARADCHLLLLGESGVGKELAARAIHRLSRRGGRPLVARNAATFPSTLLDSELFGNAKNYPNVGTPDRVGLIGESNGSNMFLDEIGELPCEQQAHLLRVLDRGGEYHRLGESEARVSHFRLYAATNRSLDALKHDFLARFAKRIHLPGLNCRRSDIPLLVGGILRHVRQNAPETAMRFFDRCDGTSNPRISPALMEALLQHDYSHHVRELEQLLWLSISTSTADFLALTPELKEELGIGESPSGDDCGPSPDEIRRALDAAGGSREQAAQMLGLKSRYALYRLMKKRRLAPTEKAEKGAPASKDFPLARRG